MDNLISFHVLLLQEKEGVLFPPEEGVTGSCFGIRKKNLSSSTFTLCLLMHLRKLLNLQTQSTDEGNPMSFSLFRGWVFKIQKLQINLSFL